MTLIISFLLCEYALRTWRLCVEKAGFTMGGQERKGKQYQSSLKNPRSRSKGTTSPRSGRHNCSLMWSGAKRNGTWGEAAQTNGACETRGIKPVKLRLCRLFHRLWLCSWSDPTFRFAPRGATNIASASQTQKQPLLTFDSFSKTLLNYKALAPWNKVVTHYPFYP